MRIRAWLTGRGRRATQGRPAVGPHGYRADGYTEDAAGRFDWAAPDEELLRFINDLERPVGTYHLPFESLPAEPGIQQGASPRRCGRSVGSRDAVRRARAY